MILFERPQEEAIGTPLWYTVDQNRKKILHYCLLPLLLKSALVLTIPKPPHIEGQKRFLDYHDIPHQPFTRASTN